MSTKVKGYTDAQLLDRVKKIKGFKGIPKDYWILGVQSNEDTYNEFDDKFYVFKGEKFITVTTGTTNAGESGLLNYNKYNKNGVAVIKTDQWYNDLWAFGYHNGRMPALKQINEILFYRDGNKNKKIEEIGPLYSGKIGINFHTVTYAKDLSFYRKLIGGWSVGCQVLNDVGDYYNILGLVEKQKTVTYCLINEF